MINYEKLFSHELLADFSVMYQKKIFLLSFIFNIKKPASAGFFQSIQW
ncbi:hypothetical protein XBKQ1_2720020 [Xenorhabdus bovienii str. kraussei Quebec]|uniref:Uncharacterized protein n=1 Tax=Xenorhabdus bovienii str. kraussei Quebec TaxID=1398203 RepID=A0A077PI01_XENBV|nr:hypothetical protein XBKQ1_2720020 [Xenorhabdus bovienii str. kraussei Quebec]